MDVADPIPPSVKALVDLFKNELALVTFPGVDGAILEQLMSDVTNYTEAVIKAEAALEAARTALRESEEVLAVKTQKALAYARVYAEDRPEVAAKVDYVARIAGAAPTPAAPARERDGGSDAPKRRGRQKKNATPEATPAPSPVEASTDSATDSADMTPATPAVMEVSVEEVDASVLDAVMN